jgi:hypothetical protein
MPAYLGRVIAGGGGLAERLSAGDPPRDGWRRLALRGLYLAQAVAGCLVLAGLGIFVVRGDWLIPSYVAASLVLIASTPWPSQFNRYLTPILPFLALSIILPLAWFAGASGRLRRERVRRSGLGVFALVVTVFLGRNLVSVVRTFAFFHTPTFGAAPWGGHRLLYYGADAAHFDAALAWLRERGEPDAIVATTAPHLVYLMTGLKAVMVPMEAAPAKEQELLDAVPVDFLIIDELAFLDISRRYARPVVERYPALWEPVYTSLRGMTTIYRRSARAGAAPRADAPPAPDRTQD